MKKIYSFCLVLMAASGFAQVPTNFGSNAEDGISYQTYNLIDHGVVSSVRFQAQNAIQAGDGTWEFFTGNYDPVWRPYSANDTLSSFNAIIDPTLETASARLNTQALGGGATGLLPAIQAGYYYTTIIQDGGGDNFMSIIETAFSPVAIDTVYNSPTSPTEADNVTVTVELANALVLSPGEHLFIRSSVDGYSSSNFLEVTNFANGVGTVTVPAGVIPAGTTVSYYALVTEETNPVAETIDYFTLFFGNNSGNNYEFTVSAVTAIEDVTTEFGIARTLDGIIIQNAAELKSVELVSVDGKQVYAQTVNGQSQISIAANHLPTGIYVLKLSCADFQKSTKIMVD
ncbi:MAG: T9SS type A sorting domain-containing protein [Flavobacteriales bacterium]|nr:T9SS type A sorting domain-containing protein [Flavobacteriales bacterium]